MGKVKNSVPWCAMCDAPLTSRELRAWHESTYMEQDYVCAECYEPSEYDSIAGMDPPGWDDLPPLDMKEGIWR